MTKQNSAPTVTASYEVPRLNIFQKLAKFLFKFHGWSLIGKEIPSEVSKCVFVFAPHTSNWDYYYGMLFMLSWGIPFKVVIKKFWTKFPFSLIINPLGGLGIDRIPGADGKRNQVDQLARAFEESERIALIITPEGTRSMRDQWKTGFYFIAKKANVPMVPLTGSYLTKALEFGPVLYPNEDLSDIMKKMMVFFGKSHPKHPDQFALDKRYVVEITQEKRSEST